MVYQVDLPRLSRRLGHEFKNVALLKQALTHRSADNKNNERLEFVGDAILSYVIAKTLFLHFPEESEGQLSRFRAFLVKGDTLGAIAAELCLGDYLFLGQGELRSGGFRRVSILADALEAVIAAVFLDAGIEAAEQLILKLYVSRIEDVDALKNNIKDYKTLLQELLQAKKQALPQYKLIKLEGEEHEQIFHIACSVKGLETSTQGVGPTRRKAEQEAAELFLSSLKKIFR